MSEYEPITGEMREWWVIKFPVMDEEKHRDFTTICDSIDAVHAGLERENAELRARVAELDESADTMHDGGSITDELREWAEGDTLRAGMSLRTARDQALAIADRIDAEHEAKVSYWQGASYKDGYDEGFASADDWLAQHEDAMAEHGWIRLPLDADGEYIHAGDVLDGYGKTIEVVEMRYGRSGWVLISRDGSGYADTFAFTHHHAPTVEDVLREFMDAMSSTHPLDAPACIAEYAARLRLAEGEDA